MIGRRRVPCHLQRAEGECAAACLRMVLDFHGRSVSAAELVELLPASRAGNSALDLVEAARNQGLDARGVLIEPAAISELRTPAIVHVAGNHFVVLERVVGGRIHVVDPAFGRAIYQLHELRPRLGRVAIELSPGPGFAARRTRSTALRRYLEPMLRQRGRVMVVLALSSLLIATTFVPAYVTGRIVDDWLASGSGDWRLALTLGAVGVTLAQVAANMLRGVVLVRLRDLVDRSLMGALIERLLRLPYTFFQRRSVGDLVMRLGTVGQIREVLTGTSLSAALDGFLAFAYFAALLWLSPTMALAASVLAALHLTLYLGSRARMHELARRHIEAEADLRGSQTRLLSGVESLLANAAIGDAQVHVGRAFDRVLACAQQRGLHGARVEGLASGLRLLAPLLVLGVGADAVARGVLTLGSMLAAAQLAAAFLVPALALVTSASAVELLRSHVTRLEEIHTHPTEPSGSVRPSSVGPLELRDLEFGYSAREPPVLHGLDLRIDAGRHVALVGLSGCGKSTLARLLVGLLRPSAGEIRFAGVALEQCDVAALRRRIALVTQVPVLFDMTIADNIAFGAGAIDRDGIVQAATLACVDEEIRGFAMGYDTMLHDGGAELSGGQRQRIALARAFARAPELLVLDEATSALDAITERAVQDALARLPCTIVTIAHRLSTVKHADVIHVLADGRIVESGRHAELLRSGRHYPALLRAQFDEAPPPTAELAS